MSWAEDMGYDQEPPEPYYSDTREYEWEDKNHHVHLISDLDNVHLNAIIKGFTKTFPEKKIHKNKYWGQRWKLDYLKKEFDKRHKFPSKELF